MEPIEEGDKVEYVGPKNHFNEWILEVNTINGDEYTCTVVLKRSEFRLVEPLREIKD